MSLGPPKCTKSRMTFKDFFRDVDDSIEYDPEDLEKGIEVEMEHTSNRDVAATIAKQHLAEDPMYYQKHQKVGL